MPCLHVDQSPACLAPGLQVDVRSPGGEPLRWMVSADVEALTWHPHQPTCFLVSSEDGIVACYDARKGAGALAPREVYKIPSLLSLPTCLLLNLSCAPERSVLVALC